MKRYAVIFLLAFLVGCHDDDETLGDAIFTFDVPDGGLTFGYSYWIILHDNENGELIGSSAIKVGARPVEFKTTKAISDKLVVTLVRYNDPGDVRIWVYNEVDVGTKWTASYPRETGDMPVRSSEVYDFVIDNVPAMYAYGASDKYGWNIDETILFQNSQIKGDFRLREGSQQLLVVDDGATNPKYKFIDKPAAGENVTVDYNEMSEFDKYLKISFPETSDIEIRVEVYDPNQIPTSSFLLSEGYEVWENHEPVKRTSVNIGLLNQFSSYRTKLKFGDFNFESVGAAPTSVEAFDRTSFKYHTGLTTDLGLETSRDYTYARSLYLYDSYNKPGENTGYQLAYHTTPSSPKQFDTLTPEIVEHLKIKKSSFRLVNFEAHLWKGRNYMEAISFGFDPKYDYTRPIEHSWVSAW